MYTRKMTPRSAILEDFATVTSSTHSGESRNNILSSLPPLITPEQASEFLGFHQNHVRALCRSGELPAVRIGSRWRIITARLVEMLEGDDES